MIYIMENLTVKYSPRKLKLHNCKTEIEDLSTYMYSPILMLTSKQDSSLF